MSTFGKRRFWLAFVGSFGVYLLPLVTRHGIWFFGEALFGELTATYGRHEPAWIAADVALGLALQTAVALGLAWWLRGTWRRSLIWPVVIPILFLVLQRQYLVAIPSRFLIEPDTAIERQAWAEHCVVPDAWLMPVRGPVSVPDQDIHEWWIQRSDGRYALLHVPSCAATDARLPQPTVEPGGRVDFMLSFQFVIADGSAVIERIDTATARRSWWLLREPDGRLDRLPVPDQLATSPILSNSGDAIAWVEPIAGTGPPVLYRVRVQSIRSGPPLDVTVDLAPFGAALYVLLEVDTPSRALTLWQDQGLLIVGFDGTLRGRSASTFPIRPQSTTYQRSRNGWLAWDAYKDEAAYQVSWSAPAGSGRNRVPKGRSITSAAFDPSGRFIAVSTTTSLSIGRILDTVYVLRASDGTEAFRRYLPPYSRSTVVFLDGGLFGYSEGGRTHVLRLPE